MPHPKHTWIVTGSLLAFIVGGVFASMTNSSTYEKSDTHVLAKEPVIARENEPLHLLFVGDVMLDRIVAVHAQKYGDDALIGEVKSLFSGKDAIIANLEGTITENPSVSIPDHTNLSFTFDPHFAAFLKNIGISAVSLSNNHTDDFGTAGYVSTKDALKDAGILSFGSPDNRDELSATLTVGEMRLCLVGYEQFINIDTAPVVAEIARIRPSCDMVVATMHAGVEYDSGFSSEQQAAAHAFIDAGADLVIGTHPHVVEPLEIYNGKPIFYSLGNFIFDQNFSFGTTHGLAVDLVWSKGKAAYELVPIAIQNEEVSFPDDDARLKTLSALIDRNLAEEVKISILQNSSFQLSD